MSYSGLQNGRIVDAGRFALPRDRFGRFAPGNRGDTWVAYARQVIAAAAAPTHGHLRTGNASVWADGQYLGSASSVDFNVTVDWSAAATSMRTMADQVRRTAQQFTLARDAWVARDNTGYSWHLNTPGYATGDWIDAGGTYPTYNTGSTNYIAPPRNPGYQVIQRVRVEQLHDHPDPDAWIGEIHDDLQRRLEEMILTDHPELATDTVWESWVWRIVDTGAAAEDGFYDFRAETIPQNYLPVHMTAEVWQSWASQTDPYYGIPAVTRPRERMPTPEELERRAWQQRRDRIVRDARHRASTLRRRLAERRARELLVSMLDEEQRADLERANHFKVHTNGRTYEVAKGYAGNVYLLDENGRRHTSYCIHATATLPDEDHMLSQKLLLESDEEEFIRIANASAAYR